MPNRSIYQYTSIARPLDPGFPTNRAVLMLMPLAAVLGAVVGWARGEAVAGLLLQALVFALIVFVSWALARELNPDDNASAFISLACGLVVAVTVASPGLLVPFVTLGLVRIVNRSTGLAARKADSVLLTVLTIVVIYLTQSPLFGLVAALAFVLDGSLRDALRQQWLFALVSVGAAVVYMVDHDVGLWQAGAPDSLFEWLALAFLLIFALDAMLTRTVLSKGDVGGRPLDAARVRGGMGVGLFAALQGIGQPADVAVVVAAIAGICIGMAFRKGFRVQVSA